MSDHGTQTELPMLGGSTIGAAVGVNAYVSPIRLWLELTTGRGPDESDAMRWGKLIEPLILAEVGAEPLTVTVPDPEREWLAGHPDGWRKQDGPPVVVDAKCSGRGYDSPPPHYIAQVQTYMHLMGLDHAEIATFTFPTLTVTGVTRSQHAIDTLLGLAADFMEHVRNGVQPAPQGHPDDRAALLAVHPSAKQGERVRETREIRDARRELKGLLDAEKARKRRIEHLRAVVADHMGDADTLIDAHDAIVATWKAAPSNRLDTDRLKEERPEIYAGYFNEGQTRRFVLK